jgi:hypothetical protein
MTFSISQFLANSDLTDAHAAAKEFARTRLASRPNIDLMQLLSDCGVEGAVSLAEQLLNLVASLLSVSVGKLRSTDVLGEILRVPHADLDECARESLRAHKIGDPLEVGSYDFLATLDELIPSERWREVFSSFEIPPRSDEEWLDRIGEMSLGEFVRAFSRKSGASGKQ